ncbi:MAG TPA: hypothetical protein VFW24_07670 [Acidimicrobiales bacterium]|nr:hypothetical protein [Acidimicrobiales bacterium]
MASDWEPELEPHDAFTWQEPPASAEPLPPARPQARRRPGRRAVLAVVGACALSGIGAGVAAAATSGSTGSSLGSSGSPGSSGPSTTPGSPRPFARHGLGLGGPGGPGMGGAIRGELVRPDPSGSGYQTVDFQTGTVTSDSPYTSTISVKSADGTEKTYAVTTDTLVDAGRDGVANISKGDTVTIEAVVSNGTATATTINDRTRLGALRKAWGYGGPGGPGAPAPGATPPSPSGT